MREGMGIGMEWDRVRQDECALQFPHVLKYSGRLIWDMMLAFYNALPFCFLLQEYPLLFLLLFKYSPLLALCSFRNSAHSSRLILIVASM